MLHALVLIGCAAQLSGRSAGDDDDGLLDAPAPVEVQAPAAFDPLMGPVDFTVVAEPGSEIDATLLDLDGRVLATWSGVADADGAFRDSWDGRDGGAWAPSGRYTLQAAVGSLGAEAAIASIRPGVLAARLEGDDGISAVREPLVWPLDGALQDDADPLTHLDAIDDGSVPLALPSVDLASPMAVRPGDAEPAAFIFDSRPLLVLEVASHSPALGSTGLELVDVEASAAGWTVLSGSPLGEAPLVLQLDEPLGDTVGISDLDVELSFTVAGDPVGTQRVPLTVYRLLDVSGFQNPEPLYRPWAPVVHQALLAIDGTPAEHAAVSDALVDWVYNDLGLVYDTVAGASAYSTYVFWAWDRPHFFLSDFLVRRFGNVINCSDAGNILGAYANMLGARLDHLIIDPNFDLNEIKAIGRASYTSCPFGAFGCGFSYHAVTTQPGSNLVWDATLALDGDVDPGASPSTELLVQGIDATEYLDRLVRRGTPRYGDMAQETIE